MSYTVKKKCLIRKNYQTSFHRPSRDKHTQHLIIVSLILPEVALDMFLNQHPCFSKVIRLPQLPGRWWGGGFERQKKKEKEMDKSLRFQAWLMTHYTANSD